MAGNVSVRIIGIVLFTGFIQRRVKRSLPFGFFNLCLDDYFVSEILKREDERLEISFSCGNYSGNCFDWGGELVRLSMPNFKGVIIEESLEKKSILKKVRIIQTKIEEVIEKHKTPWIKQWTLHTVEIFGSQADAVAEELSQSLDSKHNWYADFKNDFYHYIIFRNKVFYIDRRSKEQYDEAKHYGISLGIPEYQVDFHPKIKEWKR